jgi:hypothetical protein
MKTDNLGMWPMSIEFNQIISKVMTDLKNKNLQIENQKYIIRQ